MGQEPRLGIHDQCSLSAAKAAAVNGVCSLYSPCVYVGGGRSEALERPLALAQLTTVLLEGGDIIRGCASENRMWDIINKLTLLR